MSDHWLHRRDFLYQSLLTGACALGARELVAQEKNLPVLGQGKFQYHLVAGWGVLDAKTPVKNCSAMVVDSKGRIFLLTDHLKNNVIIYNKDGQLLNKWGTQFPSAHGLEIVQEENREVLFITDLNRHRVFKTTLDGEILMELTYPKSIGKYASEKEFRPSWTLHLPNGDFFVLDGYGKDYIMRYNRDGKLLNYFGGPEGGIAHWGPHGGIIDVRGPGEPELVIAMSDQQTIKRLTLDGKLMEEISLPGSNPRMIQIVGDYIFVPHLADNWPKDRQSRGYISVLDRDYQIVSNIGGSAPRYVNGKLQPMQQQGGFFRHPHDLVVASDGAIYVPQFASGNTYPVKLVPET
ncbi:NHL repeat-containing protein [Gimesia aquarii]|uniref:NHL repeat protein n=1 Tax=Gimesia aquarii TaxID=2527964 RepID=A0A517VNI4_9PLAN|nr:6-bladed beta-propeller [Gimesia aquarii]QDT94581.1 NHL repeat protein [Gimesia aquarii]